MEQGEKLKAFAKLNFDSLKDLADALDITQTTLSRYVQGQREPTAEILRKLQKLGCDMNWLLNDDDDSPPNTIQDNKSMEEQIRHLRDRIKQVSQVSTVLEGIENQIKKLKKL